MSFGACDAPIKVMIRDLSQFEKSGTSWLFNFNGEIKVPMKLNKIHIQGEINKTAGFLKEILIISDGTAKAKITRGPKVPGDLSWVAEGVQCSVIGNLVDNGKLPHVNGIKIAKITNPVLQEMWPIEVEELKNVILGKVSPNLAEAS